MKIIQPSNMPWVGQHTCSVCKCVFELTKDDAELVTETKTRGCMYMAADIDRSKPRWNMIYTQYRISCPECGHAATVAEERHIGTPEELKTVRKLGDAVWINNQRIYEVPDDDREEAER